MAGMYVYCTGKTLIVCFDLPHVKITQVDIKFAIQLLNQNHIALSGWSKV